MSLKRRRYCASSCSCERQGELLYIEIWVDIVMRYSMRFLLKWVVENALRPARCSRQGIRSNLQSPFYTSRFPSTVGASDTASDCFHPPSESFNPTRMTTSTFHQSSRNKKTVDTSPASISPHHSISHISLTPF